MKDIIYSSIKPTKIKTLKTKDGKKKLGILHAGIFFDLTKEVKRIRKEEAEKIKGKVKEQILKKGETITHTTTNEVTHIILSLRDLDKLNLGGR